MTHESIFNYQTSITLKKSLLFIPNETINTAITEFFSNKIKKFITSNENGGVVA